MFMEVEDRRYFDFIEEGGRQLTVGSGPVGVNSQQWAVGSL